ncbi:MAG: rRNA pseudouridine synthase [Oscillospiraceae bacterium]|nr:rRNA pseudouridine synthase [Oscillospiraceae bacterium]
MKQRLDKFMSTQTIYTRTDISKLLWKRKVSVNGKIVREGEMKIDPEKDKVEISGQEIVYRDKIYLILNKPDGYVSATEDKNDPTVIDLVPDEFKRKDIFPAGRLDKDSEGMVLITNDGPLSHRILSPKKHIPKYYMVKLSEKFGENYEELFLKGLTISGGEECLPARVKACPCAENVAFIELFEGKYHQVKRMFEAVENSVEKLVRIQMGGLQMPVELELGGCMEVLYNDVENLLKKPSFEDVFKNFSVQFSSYWINRLD